MHVYTVYKYQIDWELTPFSFLRGGTFAWGSLKSLSLVVYMEFLDMEKFTSILCLFVCLFV